MGFNNADLLAIKNEINGNPLALSGYLPHVGANDEANANALSLVRTETKIDREAIPQSEIARKVDADEFIALSQGQRDYMLYMSISGSVDPRSGGEVREGLMQLFSAQSETRANLLAIIQEPASRIDQLFKAGTLSQGGQCTPSDVSNARNAV